MIKLHRKVEYALIALKHLSQQPVEVLTSASEIVQTYKTPAELTARVLQVLAKKGFVRSLPGLRGGYQLNRDLNEISLFDLLAALEGSTEIARCLLEHSSKCEVFATCNIIQPIQVLDQRIEQFYRSITLAELMNAGVSAMDLDKKSEPVSREPSTPEMNHV